jgi:DNA-binding beta-propeller fold protein YncE
MRPSKLLCRCVKINFSQLKGVHVVTKRLSALITALFFAVPLFPDQTGKTQHLLYVASPGIRNYTEWGGVGVLVFDIDNGYKLVKRFPTWQYAAGEKVENVKGFAASAATGKMYVTNINKMMALDIVTGKKLWDKSYEGGCDRLAISPDGKKLYVPQLEGPAWHVVNADTGEVTATLEPKSGSHNTVWAPDGSRVYLGGLKSPLLRIADPKTDTIMGTVGPFAAGIRPFTVNGSNTLVFVNVNELLGFEVGDVQTGKKLYRVEVQGYKQGPVKRHSCPSHGIALTPDEKELWVADGANNAIHIFCTSTSFPAGLASAWMAGTLTPQRARLSTPRPRRPSLLFTTRMATWSKARSCWIWKLQTAR